MKLFQLKDKVVIHTVMNLFKKLERMLMKKDFKISYYIHVCLCESGFFPTTCIGIKIVMTTV